MYCRKLFKFKYARLSQYNINSFSRMRFKYISTLKNNLIIDSPLKQKALPYKQVFWVEKTGSSYYRYYNAY